MPYPAWRGQRVSLAAAIDAGGGAVAGRYLRSSHHDLLRDESKVIELRRSPDPRPTHGALVSGTLHALPGDDFMLTDVVELAPCTWSQATENLFAKAQALALRAQILAAVRASFRGFLEVETPARVLNPGLEPHLRPFAAGLGKDGRQRFLVTSPELHLKQLLAAGYERVFEFARAFRDDELGRHHRSEFTLLEWYRAYAGLADLVVDVTTLLAVVAATVKAAVGNPGVLAAPPVVRPYGELFRERTGVDPSTLTVDDRERRFVAEVEPHLGREAPLLVIEYPPDACALARLQLPSYPMARWPQVAARMELYVAGVELANGFDELNDPTEQRRRQLADLDQRQRLGQATPDLDLPFLTSLEHGMPPAAGMALGLDRLVLVAAGKADLAEVCAF